MFALIRKIRNAISSVIFLYTLIISLHGLAKLGQDLAQELKYQWRRRFRDITRFQSSRY